jgi:thymidylate synthase
MIVVNDKVSDVREWFRYLKKNEEYVIDKTGSKMLEVVGATFIADENPIFGTVNFDYVNREIEWYKSMSRSILDIPGGPPKGWQVCASKDRMINSNYGWMIWHKDNYDQYQNVLTELQLKPFSRRAVMIYTRPQIWNEFNTDGMSDFICTNAVQYFIRDNELVSVVQMRSNDLVFGYKNDKRSRFRSGSDDLARRFASRLRETLRSDH